jgi:hypothetical protein
MTRIPAMLSRHPAQDAVELAVVARDTGMDVGVVAAAVAVAVVVVVVVIAVAAVVGNRRNLSLNPSRFFSAVPSLRLLFPRSLLRLPHLGTLPKRRPQLRQLSLPTTAAARKAGNVVVVGVEVALVEVEAVSAVARSRTMTAVVDSRCSSALLARR